MLRSMVIFGSFTYLAEPKGGVPAGACGGCLKYTPKPPHGRGVVILDDDAAVGHLRLKVKRDGSAAQGQSADDRVPVGAIGMNAQDAPAGVVLALNFDRAEDDAAILEHDRVQGLADVQVADLFHVLLANFGRSGEPSRTF